MKCVEAISVPIARSTAGVEPFYLYQTFLSLFSPFSSNIRHKIFFLEFTVFTKYWGFGLKLFSSVYKALISQNSQEMGIFNFNYFSPNLSANVIAVLLIFLIFLKYILISFNLKFLKFMYYSLNMIKTLYFWEKYFIVIKSI